MLSINKIKYLALLQIFHFSNKVCYKQNLQVTDMIHRFQPKNQ